jgi:hypothetical protein
VSSGLQIFPYQSSMGREWDEFIVGARNHHFMFQRSYMDYHSDRFLDASILVSDSAGELIAALPANFCDGNVFSHQGLTFGGFISSSRFTTERAVRAVELAARYYKEAFKAKALIYRRIPDFYHTFPAQEDLYALFRQGAELIGREVSSTILLTEKYSYKKRQYLINRASSNLISVEENRDFTDFWPILSSALARHGRSAPTHSLSEISLLVERFPKNIRGFFATGRDGHILAGAIAYETRTTAHTQYLASNDEGRRLGALDLVIHHLLTKVYANKRFFDFGVSTEQHGNYLNSGLVAQKEGFGARAFVHDTYRVNLESFVVT